LWEAAPLVLVLDLPRCCMRPAGRQAEPDLFVVPLPEQHCTLGAMAVGVSTGLTAVTATMP